MQQRRTFADVHSVSENSHLDKSVHSQVHDRPNSHSKANLSVSSCLTILTSTLPSDLFSWSSFSSLAWEVTLRHQRQSHLRPLGRIFWLVIVHVCTICVLSYTSARSTHSGHHVSDTCTGLQRTYHVGTCRPAFTPDPGVRWSLTRLQFECFGKRLEHRIFLLCEFRSLLLWCITLCRIALWFFSLMVPNQAHDKSTRQQCQDRNDFAWFRSRFSLMSRCFLFLAVVSFSSLVCTLQTWIELRIVLRLVFHRHWFIMHWWYDSPCSYSCVLSLSLSTSADATVPTSTCNSLFLAL